MAGKPTAKPVIHSFFDEPTNTVSYIVADPATKEAAFIDPVLDYDPGASEVDTRSVEAMLRFARDKGYRVTWTLETNAHADYLSGSPYVKAKTGDFLCAPRGPLDRAVCRHLGR